MSKEFKFGNGEYTLGEADAETLKAEVLYMSVYIRNKNADVINVYKTE